MLGHFFSAPVRRVTLVAFAVLLLAGGTAVFGAAPAPAAGSDGIVTPNEAVDGPGHCVVGTPSNCNGFDGKQYAWLNGDAQLSYAGDGTYFFAILEPGVADSPLDGEPWNLSDDYDTYQNRTFTISGGVISYTGTHDFANNMIRLVPYVTTPNSGGEYKFAWCSLANGYPVSSSDCRFTTFKTEEGAPPDLVVTKSDGGMSATAGQTVTYAVGYSNSSAYAATGVTLTETVPQYTTFDAASSTAGWSCANGAPAGTTCTFALGTLQAGASGSVNFAVTVANPVPMGVTQISNTVTISDDGTHGTDPTPADNTATDTTPVTPDPADLAVTKSDGGVSAKPGQTIVYALGYRNQDDSLATGVTLTETVPQYTTFDAASSTAGWSCANGAPAGTTCTFALGTLQIGDSGSVSFAVTVVNPVPAGVTQISNTVTISDDGTHGTDPTPGDNTATDTTPVTPDPADLAVTKSDGGIAAKPGQVVVYALGYRNQDDSLATGVTLTETVPQYTTFNAASSTAGWSCANGAPAGTTCTFALGTLQIGDSGSVNFAVTVVNPVPAGLTQISNTVTISDDGTHGTDPTPGDNTATDITPIRLTWDLCAKGTLATAAAGEFPGNTGPDYWVRTDLGQSIQAQVDTATDVNGDGSIIVGVIGTPSGALGGTTTQNILIDRAFPKPFGLFGCSVTLRDPTPGDANPVGAITANASGPKIMVMDIHATGSATDGWRIAGDGRVFRNVRSFQNGTGVRVTGNNNVVKNAVAFERNAGDGLVVSGNGNTLDTNKVGLNQGNGVVVTGDNNRILKNTSGAASYGNTGAGYVVTGSGNWLSENKASANGGAGFSVSGGTAAPNLLAKNQSNTGAAGGSLENKGAEYLLANGVRNDGGGNKADNVLIPKLSAPQKCPLFPATNTTAAFASPYACE